MKTMTMHGVGSGVIVDDFTAYNVGDEFEIDGKSYLIAKKECLSKYTDGIYKNRPGFLVLRGFNMPV